jgi:hypothetical protein
MDGKRMRLIPVILIALCTTIQAGTVKMTSQSLNVTAEFQGALIPTSPTISVTADGQKMVMTMKQFRSIQQISNVLIPTGPQALVTFDVTIGK